MDIGKELTLIDDEDVGFLNFFVCSKWFEGRREDAINQPGHWDFFLSHAQATACDQCRVLCELLRARNKRVWLDNEVNERSEAAMKEGVQWCANFVLFLSGTP